MTKTKKNTESQPREYIAGATDYDYGVIDPGTSKARYDALTVVTLPSNNQKVLAGSYCLLKKLLMTHTAHFILRIPQIVSD